MGVDEKERSGRKEKSPFSWTLDMAQEQGFEPWHRVTDLQAFQACPFNHLGIPALLYSALVYISTSFTECKGLFLILYQKI